MTDTPLCVVSYTRDERPDAALAEAVRRLKAAGVRVGGLLQEGEAGDASCCATLHLQDIVTGRRIEVFQNRGVEARGCRLDASGLAEAAAWLREAVEARPDVLFVNRFGRQEAEGRGLLDEIGAAVLAEIPVVIPVGQAVLPAWIAYTGAQPSTVPAAAATIEAWCLERVRQTVA